MFISELPTVEDEDGAAGSLMLELAQRVWASMEQVHSGIDSRHLTSDVRHRGRAGSYRQWSSGHANRRCTTAGRILNIVKSYSARTPVPTCSDHKRRDTVMRFSLTTI